MNLYLQFAIPLAATFLILLLIAALRRYRRADAFVLCGVVLVLALATGIPGLRTMSAGARAQQELAEETGAASGEVFDQLENNLILVRQYMLDGNLEQAGALIDTLGGMDASEPRTVLVAARLAFLEERWSDASLLYRKAGALFGADSDQVPEDEAEAARKLAAFRNGGGAQAMAAYLMSQEIAPGEYGLTSKVTSTDVDSGSIADLILERLESELEDLLTDEEELEENGPVTAAVNASRVTRAFSAYLEKGEYSEDQVRKYTSRLARIMDEDPALNQNAELRTARLKGYVLLNDYEALAGGVDSDASLEELMIVSELYLSGYVKERDFSETYTGVEEENLDRVLEQCEHILDAELADAGKTVRSTYKEKVDSLKSLKDSSALGSLRRDLRSRTAASRGELTSKAWLELAKIEQHLGNEAVADEYITEAFGTVSLSSDDQYIVPMNSLLGIISGSSAGGTEDLKKVAEYVDEAVNNSLPLDITVGQLTAGSGETPDSSTSQAASGFTEYMTDNVSQKTAVLNIGVINKDAFPTVKARIQVNSSRITGLDDMRQYLNVYDCNSEITQFTVEKLDFQTSRIILLCDVSGSMSGNVESLKNAITRFADEMNAGEAISVIGFDDSIVFEHDFSEDPSRVAGYADEIGAYGGTDMFSALQYAMGLFPDDINANNIVILMTDGQDNNPKGEATIRNEIGALAANRAVTVYTLGLGSSVDTAYLTLLADAGNGSFLYVDSDASLDSFYDFIHRQLTSQYILTYVARNTTLNQRKLEVSVEGELGSAEKTYYLVEPEYSNQSSEGYDPYVVTDTDIKLYGLSTKFLYRSARDQTVNLKGEGFDPTEDITVKISGNVDYVLTATYEDANTYSLLIPANVATGVYDLEVSVRGESFTMGKELTLAAQGSEKTFRYGAYEFTALSSYVDGSGATVLSGNVTMNGWLRFMGDVTVVGEYLDSGRVTLRDNSGSYVTYAENNSSGLAHYLAEKGVTLTLPALGEFDIYVNDYSARDYEDFPVDQINQLENLNLLCLVVENFNLSLYPDCIRFSGLNFNYNLPFQKQLLRNLPEKFSKNLDESGGFSTGMLINATEIGFVGTVKYSYLKDVDFSMVSVPLKLTSLSVEIDTLRNDYKLEAEVSFKALKDMDSLSMGFEVKEGKFDAISLAVGGDYSVPIMKTPVPITISDFGFELSGFSTLAQDNNLLTKILGRTITFQFQTNVGDVSSMLPGLKKLITDGKLAAATLKDCKVSATLKTFSFKFEADVYLLTVLDVGHCEIEAGSFKYTNDLLGFNGETQYGLRAAVTLGSKWDTNNCYVEMTGTAELTLGYPYTGLWLDGDLGFEVGWWILKADWDVSGDFLVAVYKNSADQAQFSMIVRGRNNRGEYSGFHLYITPTTGMDVYRY